MAKSKAVVRVRYVIYLAERLYKNHWVPLYNPFIEYVPEKPITAKLSKVYAEKQVDSMNRQWPTQKHRVSRYVRGTK